MSPASASTASVISSTYSISFADLYRAGFLSNRPSTSLRIIRRSASIFAAIFAASVSLSPNLSSSVAVESFSLTIGTTVPRSNNAWIVLRTFR